MTPTFHFMIVANGANANSTHLISMTKLPVEFCRLCMHV